mmetsp:Transcript_127236/g.354265  ORF Transcript_127236/g.354265 Transcript_127236/m.354265 type:complete len:204 (+) Transcript_127236:511-1122(+)
MGSVSGVWCSSRFLGGYVDSRCRRSRRRAEGGSLFAARCRRGARGERLRAGSGCTGSGFWTEEAFLDQEAFFHLRHCRDQGMRPKARRKPLGHWRVLLQAQQQLHDGDVFAFGLEVRAASKQHFQGVDVAAQRRAMRGGAPKYVLGVEVRASMREQAEDCRTIPQLLLEERVPTRTKAHVPGCRMRCSVAGVVAHVDIRPEIR